MSTKIPKLRWWNKGASRGHTLDISDYSWVLNTPYHTFLALNEMCALLSHIKSRN